MQRLQVTSLRAKSLRISARFLESFVEARQLRRGHAPDDTARQAARDGERGADTDARVVSVALAVGVRFA